MQIQALKTVSERLYQAYTICKNFLGKTRGTRAGISILIIFALFGIAIDAALFHNDIEIGLTNVKMEVNQVMVGIVTGLSLMGIVLLHEVYPTIYWGLRRLFHYMFLVWFAVTLYHLSPAVMSPIIHNVTDNLRHDRAIPHDNTPSLDEVDPEQLREEREILEQERAIKTIFKENGLDDVGFVANFSYLRFALVFSTISVLLLLEAAFYHGRKLPRRRQAKEYIATFDQFHTVQKELERIRVYITDLQNPRLQRATIRTVQDHLVRIYRTGLGIPGELLNEYLMYGKDLDNGFSGNLYRLRWVAKVSVEHTRERLNACYQSLKEIEQYLVPVEAPTTIELHGPTAIYQPFHRNGNGRINHLLLNGGNHA